MKVGGIHREYIVHDEENIKGFFGPYRWLSNFHKCEIMFDGMVFPSTENAYMYAKIPAAKKEECSEEMGTLLHCEPFEAKALGNKVPLRADWDRVKYDVMSAVCFDKYYRHTDLREKLLATGGKYIEETNHWNDKCWGVCDGTGKNWLGKIHMRIRDFWGAQYPDKLNKKKVTELF